MGEILSFLDRNSGIIPDLSSGKPHMELSIYFDEDGRAWIQGNSISIDIVQTFQIEELEWNCISANHISKSDLEPEHWILIPIMTSEGNRERISNAFNELSGEEVKSEEEIYYMKVMKRLRKEDMSNKEINFQFKSLSKEKYISVYGFGKNVKGSNL